MSTWTEEPVSFGFSRWRRGPWMVQRSPGYPQTNVFFEGRHVAYSTTIEVAKRYCDNHAWERGGPIP